MKNVNIRYIDSTSSVVGGAISIAGPYVTGGSASPADLNSSDKFFIYPGTLGNVDPFFLKNNKNPLIATLETEFRIGFNSESQQSTLYNFAKELMVFETKPFKSSIDIYYETSSTGLVSDFNTSIAYPTGASGQPSDISSFIATWQETIVVGSDVTNVFQCVDSNGNSITTGNPQIKILDVKNSTTNTSVNNPFDLTVVQQAGFNTPETYKLTTNRAIYYSGTSYQDDSLLIDFELTADNMQSVVVQKSINLTNVTPQVRGIVSSTIRTYKDFLVADNAFIEEKSQSDINNFVAGTEIDWIAAPLTGSGAVIPYSTVKTAIVAGREQVLDIFGDYIDTSITVMSHTTNGCEVISNPSSANKNAEGMPRIEGLEYSLISVKRHRAGFNPSTNKFKRYSTASTVDTVDKTFDFSINSGGTIRFNPGGTFPNSAWSWHNSIQSDPAFVYVITLGIKDASGGLGNIQNPFSFFFILTKKDYS
jgi:hypothetical protein